MSKPFPYWLRLSIVSSLSVLLSFNPAFAGRVIHRAACGSGYRVPSATAWVNDCCTPTVVESSCGCEAAAVIPADCGCGCGGSTSASTVVEPISVPECGCGSAASGSSMMPSPMEHSSSSETTMPSMAPQPRHTDSSSTPVAPRKNRSSQRSSRKSSRKSTRPSHRPMICFRRHRRLRHNRKMTFLRHRQTSRQPSLQHQLRTICSHQHLSLRNLWPRQPTICFPLLLR
jgi:hypothetical protein